MESRSIHSTFLLFSTSGASSLKQISRQENTDIKAAVQLNTDTVAGATVKSRVIVPYAVSPFLNGIENRIKLGNIEKPDCLCYLHQESHTSI